MLPNGAGSQTRRLVEQQSAKLPVCVSQQQQSRQPQQQYRFSGCMRGPSALQSMVLEF